MQNKFLLHLGAMAVLTFVAVFVTQKYSLPSEYEGVEVDIYLFGRTFTCMAVPLFLAAIPALPYRLIKKKTMPGFYIVLWILWVIFNAMAIAGSMVNGVS